MPKPKKNMGIQQVLLHPGSETKAINANYVPVNDAPDFYLVSSAGAVYSKRSTKYLSQSLTGGYPTVTLFYGGTRKKTYVHHLVAVAYLGNPPGKIGCCVGDYTVNHKDLVKTNNDWRNLEWITVSENVQHGLNAGAIKALQGSAKTEAKLSESDIPIIRDLLSAGVRVADIAKRFGVVRGTIYAVKSGRVWQHVE